MLVSKLAILGSALLASTVLAESSQLKARLSRRHNHRRSGLINRDDSNIQYYATWAGAIWDTENGNLDTIAGAITVPTSVTGSGVGSFWIGIDGRYCSPGLFQAGFDIYLDGNGEPSYHAWYQWYPQESVYDVMPIKPEDVIKITIHATSTTSGDLVMENLTTKVSVRKSLSYPEDSLCLKSAEWIVEDYNGDSNGPLIKFGSVTFTNATATGPSGEMYTPSGAGIAEIRQNGVIYTSTTTDGSSVTIQNI